MSFSANHKIKRNKWDYLNKRYIDVKIDKYINNKRDSSKKDESRLNISKLNNKSIPTTTFSNSSITTNISVVKDKEKEKYIDKSIKNEKDYSYTSYQYPIKPIVEDSYENTFVSKQKKEYKSTEVINTKIITFQKQKDKTIKDFALFDDKLIFKEINRSYLQDEHDDDGSESSDEKINDGKLFLTQELEDSAKVLSKNIKKNKDKKFLSRRIKFKN